LHLFNILTVIRLGGPFRVICVEILARYPYRAAEFSSPTR
jgi:hypothetical protein